MDNVINMGEFIGAATGDKRHMLGKFLYFSLSNLLVEKEELSALGAKVFASSAAELYDKIKAF